VSTRTRLAETAPTRKSGAGREKICIKVAVAALVDTNVLVYRFDPRFPRKQGLAADLLRRAIADDNARVPHQAIVEFVAVVTRPVGRRPPLLSATEAVREAEELLSQFTVLYPTEEVVRLALRGMVAYQLGWFDAHIWAYAEHFGLTEIWTEDFQADRLYGSVRIVNPFAA
jgi:predicted nucleic acid-binding protein